MDENQIPAIETGSHVFQSWLTQWKITVASDSCARHVLAELVYSHSECHAQHPFWTSVADYLTGEGHRAQAEVDSPQNTSTAPGALARQIDELDASSAKRLLQFLATTQGLRLERTQFWQMASDAMDRFEAESGRQQSDPGRPQ